MELVRKYWVDEQKILGASNPSTEILGELFNEGFRTVISLIAERLNPLNYDLDQIKQMGYTWHLIPVIDRHAPTPEQIREFLRLLDESLNKGKVLIHCQGGSGRTGTMAAAYWISKGLTANKAIARVREANPLAVESPAQKESLFWFEREVRDRGIV
ncbi:MAG: protein-tyrosine phosphatase family protein [Nitrospiria bacterium]